MPSNAHWRFRIVLFLWLLQCFAYFVPGATWSPVSRMGLTRAVVEQHALDVDDWAEATGDRAFREGRWYSDKAPFPSFVAVPGYAALRGYQRLVDKDAPSFEVVRAERVVAERVEVNSSFSRLLYISSFTTSGLGGALLGLLLFELLRRRFTSSSAFVATALTCLATPLFPYSTSFFGHIPAAVSLLGAIVLLDDEDPSCRALTFAGGLLAASVGCEYLAALPAGAIGLWAMIRAEGGPRGRRFAWLLLGAAGPILLLGGYHQVCFGAPWRTGYSHLVDPVFTAGHSEGWMGIRAPTSGALWGLFFGARRGLFYLAPITLLGAAGVVTYLRRERDGLVAAFGLGAVALITANAGYYMWWGGAATGPRHLTPILSLLALGLAEAWRWRRLRWVFIGLAVVSLANMLVLTGVGPEAPETGDALRDYAWRRFGRGELALLPGASNLGIALGLPRGASLAPLAVWILVGLRILWAEARGLQGIFEEPPS